MDIEQKTIGVLEALTRLAEEYGPFLFAILFIVFITRTARRYYVECMARKSPKPTPKEQQTYRLYFLSSVWVGIAVMALAIGWWVYQRAVGNHVYYVSIVNLGPDEIVAASDYNSYSRKNDHPPFPGMQSKHDMAFVIVRPQPLRSNEELKFQYGRQQGSPPPGASLAPLVPQSLVAKYAGSKVISYKVVNDRNGSRLELADKGSPNYSTLAAAAPKSGNP